MSEEPEVYTREQLSEMSRLKLRRICKKLDKSSEDCSQMDFDQMVDLICSSQEGGEEDKKPAPKASAKGGKRSAPPKGGRKAPSKTPPKTPPKTQVKTEEGTSLVGDEILAKVTSTDEKIDTVGEVMDQNLNAITEDLNELRADVYKILELLKHMGAWMENDQILTADGAPESLGFQEKEAEIDAECSGNEGGDE
jgi:hypothetical protein